MRILGIDPGTATTGFGVIDCEGGQMVFVDGGVITTLPTEAMPDRLVTICDEVGQLIAEHQPDQVVVEQLYFAQNVTTAMTVGQARGVVLLVAAQAGLPVQEFTPLQVKQAMTGYGRATKNQIQEMVKRLLSLDTIPQPDDAADALAIAITAAHSPLRHSL